MDNIKQIFANELAHSSMVYMRLLGRQRNLYGFDDFFASMDPQIADSLVTTVKSGIVKELVRGGGDPSNARSRVANELRNVSVSRDIFSTARAKFEECLTLIPRVEEIYRFNAHKNELVYDFTRFVIGHLKKNNCSLTVENFNHVLDTRFTVELVCKVYEQTFKKMLSKNNRFTADEIETAYRIILADHVETGSDTLANDLISATKKFFADNREVLIKA